MLEPRHPRCIRPHSETATAASMVDRQATRIVDLEGQLASARGQLHDANNRVQGAEGALELLASLLGLDARAKPAQVVAAAMARLK